MSDAINSQRIATDIIFLETDSSRGMDVDEWEAKILSRYPTLQARVARAAEWIQMLVAEAVAAEREAIIAICMKAGDTALANKCGEIAGAMYVTVARIRARTGEKVEVGR